MVKPSVETRAASDCASASLAYSKVWTSPQSGHPSDLSLDLLSVSGLPSRLALAVCNCENETISRMEKRGLSLNNPHKIFRNDVRFSIDSVWT